MKRIFYFLVGMILFSGCIFFPEKTDTIYCTTEVYPQSDTIYVGDTIHLKNVIDNYYTLENGKTYDISNADIIYACIVKPYESNNSVINFDEYKSQLTAFNVIPEQINGRGEVFNYGLNNECTGGHYESIADKMYANLGLIAQDTGLFIIKSFSFPVDKNSKQGVKHRFIIEYNFQLSDEHTLNNKIEPDSLKDKFYFVYVKSKK